MKDSTKKILTIILVGILVYIISTLNGFVWDDEEQIVNNTLIHSVSNWPIFFTGGAFNSGGAGNLVGTYYRPLMTLSFSIVYSIFGGSPIPFHLLSLILHISNAVFVFLIFKKFFRHNIPLILALIFLVHPLISEVVFYAANLQDVLFVFFGLLALYLTMGDKKNSKKYIAIFIFFLASLLSKEVGIVFIAGVIIYTLFFGKKNTKPLTLASITALLTYLAMRFGISKIGFSKNTIAPIANQNLGVRLFTIPKIVVYYLHNLIYPANLVPNQHWIIVNPTLTRFWLPLLVSTAFLILICIPVFRKNKIYTFFLFIFLASLILHLQIIPLDSTVSGRWFYLPFFGLLGMIGTVITNSRLSVLNSGNKLLICGGIIIALLSIRTFVRSLDWYNGLTLYSHDAKILPNDFNLENNLGVELYRIGKKDEAGIHFQTSVDLAPNWWTNWNNLGVYRQDQGDLTGAEADYKKAIDNGNYYLAYENYARILIKEGKITEAKDFLENKALKYFPENQNLKLIYQYLLQKK